MQTTSETYRRLLQTQHSTESKLVVNNETFSENCLVSMKATHTVLGENRPCLGCCCSGELDVEMLAPEVSFPRMASLRPYVRLTGQLTVICEETVPTVYVEVFDGIEVTVYDTISIVDGQIQYSDAHTYTFPSSTKPAVLIGKYLEMQGNPHKIGAAVYSPQRMLLSISSTKRLFVRPEDCSSEWIPKGVFYIDTRKKHITEGDEKVLTLHAYDGMLKAEKNYATTALNFPQHPYPVVQEIASALGWTIETDTATLLQSSNYNIPLPTAYSYREVLQQIAAAFGGNFIMNENGELKLIALYDTVRSDDLLLVNGYVLLIGGDGICV